MVCGEGQVVKSRQAVHGMVFSPRFREVRGHGGVAKK